MKLLVLFGTICLTLTLFNQGGRAEQVCCKDVGCFNDDPPFDHLPMPQCPEQMGVTFTHFSRQEGSATLDRKTVPTTHDPSKRTVFIVHGYRNDGSETWIKDMKDALLGREDLNVVVVSWGGGSHHLWYPSAAANVRTVGAEAAAIIDSMVTRTQGAHDRVWCVGHSLGAHICGHTGIRTRQQIARVTAMDPAGPEFDSYDINVGLSPLAAVFVDVIHTDGWGLTPAFYGTLRPLGHIDFYPNAGYHQPGCWTYGLNAAVPPGLVGKTKRASDTDMVPYGISCSHSRAPELFTASVRHASCFKAKHLCTDQNQLPESCEEYSTTVTEMGYAADSDTYRRSGKIYLKTLGSEPFCRN